MGYQSNLYFTQMEISEKNVLFFKVQLALQLNELFADPVKKVSSQ